MKKILLLTFGMLVSFALFFLHGDFGADLNTDSNAGIMLSAEESTLAAKGFIEPEYYGRTALAALPNSEALLFAYDSICAGVEACAEKIDIYDGEHPISKSELLCAYTAYRNDRTEHFWLGNSYTISSTATSVVSIAPTYLIKGEALKLAKIRFNREADKLLALVSPEMSEFERELVLHDALAEKIVYTIDAPNAHDAYGALVDGLAVCEGYAEALRYLLFKVGIQSFIVTGASINPSTGASEGHAWNMVRIDGKYYHTDLTWNDQKNHTFHSYFNVTDAVIKEDHAIDVPAYGLPECSSTEAAYFSVKEGAFTDYSVEALGEKLDQNGLSVHVYISGDLEQFILWYYDNIREIAAIAGVTGRFSYGYSCLGREFVLTITPSAVITKMSVSIDKGLAFNLYVKAGDDSIFNTGALAVRFSFAGQTVTVTDYDMKDGERVFSLEGVLFFHQMCEQISAELLLIPNGTLVGSGEEYRVLDAESELSVESYCLTLLKLYESVPEVSNLAAALLTLGAEAQKYMNYKTEKLPADDVDLPDLNFVPEEGDALKISGGGEELYIKNVTVSYDGTSDGGFKIVIDVCYNSEKALSGSFPVAVFATEDVALGERRYILESESALGFDNFKTASFSLGEDSLNISFCLNSCIYEALKTGTCSDISEDFALAICRLGAAADTYAVMWM